MNFPVQELPKDKFPKVLLEIPQPPKTLNYRGKLPTEDMKLLAVVGSRHYTDYGKKVVEHLISGLRGHNIGIVSGLALGIDSLAHQVALDNKLYTLAIPGGGLDDKVIYPRRHLALAHQILEAGGGMLSDFKPDFHVTKWSFTQRNRLVCGISKATLIIEASEKSGTLITARLTADYNRDLLVVPGDIFSENSKGVHQFLKLGATPITSPEDILDVLGTEVKAVAPASRAVALSAEETRVMEILHEPTKHDVLISKLAIPISAASIILTQMEIAGHIVEENGVYRKSP